MYDYSFKKEKSYFTIFQRKMIGNYQRKRRLKDEWKKIKMVENITLCF